MLILIYIGSFIENIFYFFGSVNKYSHEALKQFEGNKATNERIHKLFTEIRRIYTVPRKKFPLTPGFFCLQKWMIAIGLDW